MAEKEVMAVVKIQIPAGKANPAPPVGTALGPHGIAIQDFCTQFNNATKDKGDTVIPCEIKIYKDRSFSFVMKSPPAAVLIRQAIGIAKGSGEPHVNKVGKITQAQLEKIAEEKMEDLNAHDIKQAAKIIGGTARSMGVDVEG